MTFIDRWCTGWLRSSGYRVADPGTPDPAEPAVAAKLLRDLKWTLFAPGIEPPGPAIRSDDAEAALVAVGFTVLPPGVLPVVSVERAKEVLHAADYSVFAPEVPPAIGAWVPERADAYPTRFVSGVEGDTVTYDCMGVTHSCKVKTFHIWRRQRHAKLHEAGA
jgi:hypothetical protein